MSNSLTTTENDLIDLIHPGEILMEDFIEGFGITQNKLAVSIGVPPRRINEIVHGKRGITADTAMRLSQYFGTSAEFWMNLQSNYELRVARRSHGAIFDAIQPLRLRSRVEPTLRRLVDEDAEAVYLAFHSPDMNRQGDVASMEDARRYVHNLIASESSHEPWAIDIGGGLVGLVCVTVDEENRSGWFWYWMSEGSRGNGWMSRAAATVADWAFDTRGLERLELGYRVNNPASGAVARAAGFVVEGVERAKFLVNGERIDVVNSGRLKTDPRPVFEALEMHTS